MTTYLPDLGTPSANWNTVPVRGHFMGTDGAAIFGTVSFTPVAYRFLDDEAKTIIIGRTITVEIDPDLGTLSTELAATDDPDIEGRGFTWEVRENFFNGRTYNIVVPLAAQDIGIDLSEVIEVPPDLGTDSADYVRIITESLAAAEAAAAAAEDAAERAEAVGDNNDEIIAYNVYKPDSETRGALDELFVNAGELIYNVRDAQFGAVGDLNNDDGPAIQAALTAAAASATSGPAVVWLPWTPKGYRVGTGLTMQSRVTLRGERRVRIRRIAGTSSSFLFNHNATRNAVIENLTIDDSIGMSSSSMIRHGTGTKDYIVRNCKFVGGVLGISRAVIKKQIASNVCTLTLDEDPADLEIGSILHVSQIDNTYDGDFTATAVSHTAPFTVSYALFAADQGVPNALSVYGGWLNGETRRTVITKASASNTITLETSAPHGYALNQNVYVTNVEGQNDGGADVTMNGVVKITALPDNTHFSYINGTHAAVPAGTASTGTIGVNTQIQSSGFLPNAIDHQNGVVGGLIEDCWFEGLANNIRVPDTQRLTIRNNLFTNWTTRVFYIVGQATSATEDLWLLTNRVQDMHIGGEIRQAVAIQGTDDAYPHKRILIASNTVRSINKSWSNKDPGGADQISLQRCEDFRVIGNYAGFGGDLGINASAQCRRGVIANNVVEHNDTAGINLGAAASTYVRDIAIVGNTVINNGQDRNHDRGYHSGISLAGNGSRILISGNMITDDQSPPTCLDAIYLKDATDVEISGNYFSPAIANRYSINGTCTNIRYQKSMDFVYSIKDYNAKGDGAADDGPAFAAASTALTGTKTQLVVPPGTYKISSSMTISCPVQFQSGAVLAPDAGATVTLAERVSGPAFGTIFGPNGTVKTGKAQTVDADWWGPKGSSSAAYTSTIPRAITSTAQGTQIRLAGKYWSTAITVIANEDTGAGDQGKSLIGISSPGIRTKSLALGLEWGAEIYLGGSLFTDLFYANGTVTIAGQPSRFGFTLDNIKFNGSKGVNNGGGSCVNLANVKDFYIGRILVEQAASRGLYVSAPSNQVIGNHIEAYSCNSHGIDLAALGDSHFNYLLSGSAGGSNSIGVQLGGGTQVNQIHSYLNTGSGVSFTADKNSVALMRCNDNGLNGVLFTNATESWIGNCLVYDNGNSVGSSTDNLRCGVRFTGTSFRNKIEHVNAVTTTATQRYGVRFDTTLTGTHNLVGSYNGSGNTLADVSLAAGTNTVDKINGTSMLSTGTTPPQIDVYTVGTSTWTKPAGAVRHRVIAIGPGAGGASGRRGLTSTVRAGGSGGAGGLVVVCDFMAADLGATENVTVGAGGIGGTAQTVDSTNGVDGGAPGLTYFGQTNNRWVYASSAGGGNGGAAGATAGGLAAGPGGSTGAAGSTTGLVGATSNSASGRGTSWTAGAGGAGGGITTGNLTSAGGTGATGVSGVNTAAVAGAADGGNGNNGDPARTNSRMGGGGASGGGSSSTTAGGNGGNGGFPGGGGGGGGATLNGFNSGAGGNGGDGAIYVITYFS